MKHLTTAARLLLGLIFTAFAFNYFVPFLPQPAPPPPEALAYAGALMGSGLLTLVKIVELVAGLALLSNRFVPLALTLLAPIVVGIVHFHVALAPHGTPISIAVLALELGLAWRYRDAYRALFTPRTAPKTESVAVPVVARA